jgi:hypothetical protein
MKVKELSIGDWVMAEGQPHQVFSINHYGVLLNTQKGLRPYNFESLTPISITPEILEKNGVALAEDYDENGGLFTCPEFSVVRYGDGYTFEVPQARVRVEHVHELQHAIRLAGIEKEIEL